MSSTQIDFKALAAPFAEHEIEWRLAQCGKKKDGSIWAKCLAYIESRAIMDRLDSVVGPQNWKPGYEFISPNQAKAPGVICRLSILIDGRWVTKEDGAEQTDIEEFKGGISSALKRAAVPWGIGRYLYRLESGFAQVAENGQYYGKTKDNVEFSWNPPELPAWALPEGAKKEQIKLPVTQKQSQKATLVSPGAAASSPGSCSHCNSLNTMIDRYNNKEIFCRDCKKKTEIDVP